MKFDWPWHPPGKKDPYKGRIILACPSAWLATLHQRSGTRLRTVNDPSHTDAHSDPAISFPTPTFPYFSTSGPPLAVCLSLPLCLSVSIFCPRNTNFRKEHIPAQRSFSFLVFSSINLPTLPSVSFYFPFHLFLFLCITPASYTPFLHPTRLSSASLLTPPPLSHHLTHNFTFLTDSQHESR